MANKILNTKVCVGFCRTIIKLNGKFLLCRMSSLVRGLLPILIIVFERINYPVLNWVNPVWVPLVFFS